MSILRMIKISLLIIFSCQALGGNNQSSNTWFSDMDQDGFHYIAGSTSVGWNMDRVVSVTPYSVDDLSIYVVRIKDKGCTSGYRDHLELNGPISADSSFLVDKLFSEVESCKDVKTGATYNTDIYLNSVGGKLHDGYLMGLTFRRYAATTNIAEGQSCSSACAIAFLGGSGRNMYGNEDSILFHTPYIQNDSGIECAGDDELMIMSQYLKMMMGQKQGERLMNRTLKYCSQEEGWSVNQHAASMFEITTDNFIPSKFKSNTAAFEFGKEFFEFAQAIKEDNKLQSDKAMKTALAVFLILSSDNQYHEQANLLAARANIHLGLFVEESKNQVLSHSKGIIDSKYKTEASVASAILLLEDLVESGYVPAFGPLGYAYSLDSPYKDIKESIGWLQRASANKDPLAMVQLARILSQSDNIKEQQRAFFFANQAADLGSSTGKYLIGLFYATGTYGAPYDPNLAFHNLMFSAKEGNETAIKWLNNMRSKHELTQEQITQLESL
ncbi:hypothetical protein [Vibrio owensii]|uniref:hypothetical protein n=1 Tax=Vibrio owensii TaxID=696485 RepID=UPI003CC5810A